METKKTVMVCVHEAKKYTRYLAAFLQVLRVVPATTALWGRLNVSARLCSRPQELLTKPGSPGSFLYPALRQMFLLLAFLVSLTMLSGCMGLASSPSTPPAPLDINNGQAASTTVDAAMVTGHAVTAYGLAPNTTYYFQVNSTDLTGYYRMSGGHTFKTSGAKIAGTISPAAGGTGASVTLSGAATATTTADSSGNYTFTGLSNGTYTAAPSHAGYTFTPSSQNVTVNRANVTGVNFTDAVETFSILGTISPTAGGSGATLTLSGTATGSTTANASGAYTFTGLASGSYTITPSNTGYVFSPASQNVSVSTSNVTGVGFTDTAIAVAPTITTQPASETVTAGQTATFTVTATGTAPLSYQWQKNGANI